jgi:F-type H+-transporting ATPase subunit b
MATPSHAQTAGTQVPAGHAEVFPPFDTTHFPSQLLWLVITFGALYLLMSKIALPRVQGILDHRQGKISGDLDRATALQKQAEDAGKAYEKTLADAKAKAQAMAQDAHAKLAADAETKRKALETDLNAKIAAAEAQIVDTKIRAMTNVDAIARETATAIVQHLTGQTPDAGAIAGAVAAAKS